MELQENHKCTLHLGLWVHSIFAEMEKTAHNNIFEKILHYEISLRLDVITNVYKLLYNFNIVVDCRVAFPHTL